MNGHEYQEIQNRLRNKLESCNGLTGNRRDGFKEGIKCAMSILHDLKEHSEDGLYYAAKKE